MKKEKTFGWALIFIILAWLPASLAQADGGYFSSESVAVSADQWAISIKNGNEISMTFSRGILVRAKTLAGLSPPRSHLPPRMSAKPAGMGTAPSSFSMNTRLRKSFMKRIADLKGKRGWT